MDEAMRNTGSGAADCSFGWGARGSVRGAGDGSVGEKRRCVLCGGGFRVMTGRGRWDKDDVGFDVSRIEGIDRTRLV